MAGNDDSDEKTEQPTRKKLKDARKKGQAHKSKDLSSTVELIVWFVLAATAIDWATDEIANLIEASLAVVNQPFMIALPALAQHALHTLVVLTAAALLPVLFIGVLTEFLQVGPMLSGEKLEPKFENMDPVEGIKKMFSLDNFIEVFKGVIKVAALVTIGWITLADLLPPLIELPWAREPHVVGSALWASAKPVFAWTIALFLLLSVADAVYQRWSYMKKMRMSMRDIKQEIKETEGDPYVKARRRQITYEMMQRTVKQASRHAKVLIVNPTHVAVAIDYDRETCPVPTIAAMGQDHLAREMREAAQEAGVPIVRNVPLARELLLRGEVDELVPADMFDVIAEVILWAQDVAEELHKASPREGTESADSANIDPNDFHNGPAGSETEAPNPKPQSKRPPRRVPGEDLTRYPAMGENIRFQHPDDDMPPFTGA